MPRTGRELATSAAASRGRNPHSPPSRCARRVAGADPLGGQDATILCEDLGFLFDKLGVYDRVVARENVSLSSVEIEVRRLRRIVELGYDPDS